LISSLTLNFINNIHGFLLDGLTNNGFKPDVDPVEWIEESKNLSPELDGFCHSKGNLVITLSSFVAGHLEELHRDLFEYNAEVNWND